jgi:hypothetical protein
MTQAWVSYTFRRSLPHTKHRQPADPDPRITLCDDAAASGHCERAAAIGALSAANPTSIAENSEHAGLIYQNKDKSYGYAEAPGGSGAESKPYDAKIPKGAHVVGDWHTHGSVSQ